MTVLTVAVTRLPSDSVAVALPRPVLDSSAGYAFIHVDPGTGLPSRFNPCEPVLYVVNPDGAPQQGVDDVHEGFRRAGVATGILFEFEGPTDEVPGDDRPLHQPQRYGRRWAPVLVGWVPMPDPGGRLHPDVLGWATHVPLMDPGGQDVAVSGTIGLSLEADRVGVGFGAGVRQGNVALHEVGHLLGLDHVTEVGSVMTTAANRGAGDWDAGDLAGLAHLGRQAGCLDVPSPG